MAKDGLNKGDERPVRAGGEGPDQEEETGEPQGDHTRNNIPADRENSKKVPDDAGPSGGGVASTVQHAHAEGRTVREENIFQLISRMNVSEKVQYAIRAPKEARTLLLKDPNKLVSVAALHSPKITIEEVEMVSKSKSVDEELLRIIAKNREWLRHYSVVVSLVTNPKTPLGIAMSLLSSLQTTDIKAISKSRAVPSALKSSAIRILQMREKHG
jgi:hypothetical protein